MNVQARAFRNSAEHRFFIAAAIGIAAIVFAGFARSYYLRSLFGMPAVAAAAARPRRGDDVLDRAVRRADVFGRGAPRGLASASRHVRRGARGPGHRRRRDRERARRRGAVQTPPTHPPAFLAILGFNLVDLLVFATFVGTASRPPAPQRSPQAADVAGHVEHARTAFRPRRQQFHRPAAGLLLRAGLRGHRYVPPSPIAPRRLRGARRCSSFRCSWRISARRLKTWIRFAKWLVT